MPMFSRTSVFSQTYGEEKERSRSVMHDREEVLCSTEDWLSGIIAQRCIAACCQRLGHCSLEWGSLSSTTAVLKLRRQGSLCCV